MCNLSWSPNCQEESNYLGCTDLNTPKLYSVTFHMHPCHYIFFLLNLGILLTCYFHFKMRWPHLHLSADPFTHIEEQMWGQNQGLHSLVSCLWPLLDAKEGMPWGQSAVMLWRWWSAASLECTGSCIRPKGWKLCNAMLSVSSHPVSAPWRHHSPHWKPGQRISLLEILTWSYMYV